MYLITKFHLPWVLFFICSSSKLEENFSSSSQYCLPACKFTYFCLSKERLLILQILLIPLYNFKVISHVKPIQNKRSPYRFSFCRAVLLLLMLYSVSSLKLRHCLTDKHLSLTRKHQSYSSQDSSCLQFSNKELTNHSKLESESFNG